MRTAALIQARMGSSRLPGKVLETICGRTMLEHVVIRVRACGGVDEIAVVTSTAARDQAIVDACREYGVSCFCGSEGDVLARYYEAARRYKADIIIRITADCPLIDPTVLEDMLARFKAALDQSKPIDYLSNSLKRTYPRGLDAEIFRFTSLQSAHAQAGEPHEREHVTPFMYQHPEQFVVKHYTGPEDLSGYRWTVDTKDDLELIRKIYEARYQDEKIITTEEVLELLKQFPELAKINSHVSQKEF